VCEGDACPLVAEIDSSEYLSLTASDGWVYYAHGSGSGRLGRVRPSGEEKDELDLGASTRLTVHSEHLYYLDFQVEVARVRLDDWSAGAQTFFSDDLIHPQYGLAVDDDHAYWTYQLGDSSTDTGVARLSLATPGASPEQIECEGNCTNVVLDSTRVYWSDGIQIRYAPRDAFVPDAVRTLVESAGIPAMNAFIASAPDELYWTIPGEAGLFRAEKRRDDQDTGTLAFDPELPQSLKIQGTTLAYADAATLRICVVDLRTNATPSCVEAVPDGAPAGTVPSLVAIDGATLFWVVDAPGTDDGGEIRSCALATL
jgi:hypothetical protein